MGESVSERVSQSVIDTNQSAGWKESVTNSESVVSQYLSMQMPQTQEYDGYQ